MFFDDILFIFPKTQSKVLIHNIKLAPKGKRKIFYYYYMANNRKIEGFTSVYQSYSDDFQIGDSVCIEYSVIFDRVSRFCKSELKPKTYK
jgi:hypothetical protein